MKRNLTGNIGLRYENYGTMHDKQDTLRNLVFGPGDTFGSRLVSGKVDFVNQFDPADNKNFAPRVGMAWDVNGNAHTVVRAGYGIAYNRIPRLPAESYRTNPPLRATATLGYLLGTPSFTYSLGDPSLPYYDYPVDPPLQVGLNALNGLKGRAFRCKRWIPTLSAPWSTTGFSASRRTSATDRSLVGHEF